jgi:hypothetical protein
LTSFLVTLARTEPGRKWVLSVEDWAEIRRLRRAEKMSISEIARVLGISRNTVRAALGSDAPPKYERKPVGSIVDAVEPRIRELLRAYPTMPATVIAERIGWTRSIRVLSGRVAELRPVYLPPDPASRTSYEPGEIAQCDLWFPPITLPVGFGQIRRPTQLPVLTMVTGYSRWLSGLLIPTRTAADLFSGWWQLIWQLGSVPRAGRDSEARARCGPLYDREPALLRRMVAGHGSLLRRMTTASSGIAGCSYHSSIRLMARKRQSFANRRDNRRTDDWGGRRTCMLGTGLRHFQRHRRPPTTRK